MRAGKLNRRVRIERNGGSENALGERVPGWTLVAEVWGDVQNLSGKRAIFAGSQGGVGTASIRIRFRVDVHAGMRAVVDGVVYQILKPLPDMKTREFTDLVCDTWEEHGKC
ncbi:phage head closure protein [Paraburkholderia sacchari]|uniref:phage head closure protein n=1 Tax=Paraburkholderia sacchari TaxID=159450 RepID=UPI001BCAE039|nr:phage head closure protein [Paraburkholderia sacchari]